MTSFQKGWFVRVCSVCSILLQDSCIFSAGQSMNISFDKWSVGVVTKDLVHSPSQVLIANGMPSWYLAAGPCFSRAVQCRDPKCSTLGRCGTIDIELGTWTAHMLMDCNYRRMAFLKFYFLLQFLFWNFLLSTRVFLKLKVSMNLKRCRRRWRDTFASRCW